MACFLKIFATAVITALVITGCDQKKSEHEGRKGESHLSFTSDGAWCWFSDPRAVYHEGNHRRTYSGWVDSAGNIVVGFYDHDDRKIETQILHHDLERDDHDNPSFFIDSTGRLSVFYSKHATGTPIFMARAKRAEDISEWEPVQKLSLNDTITYARLSDTYTYTNIIQLSDEKNKWYLFWRGADFKPNFSVSEDNGKNWQPGKILILPERIYKNRRPYLKVASNNEDVIHFAFTDGHPNAEPTNSIYYMKYHQGGFFKADGDKMIQSSEVPVNPAEADLVYHAKPSGEKAWIWDVAEDEDGNPVVVYARFPSDSNHVYYYAIYNEGSWNNYRLTDSGGWFPDTLPGRPEREPNYSGGIVLDHDNPSHVYLSREINGVFEIEKWITPDKGKNWKVTPVTRNSDFDNVRPFVVRGYQKGSPPVLWMNTKKYLHYTDYQGEIKMWLGGEDQP
jgi:hypothetical protein